MRGAAGASCRVRAATRAVESSDGTLGVFEEQLVRDDAVHLENDRKYASASLGIAYSGINFFYSHTTPT